MNSRNAFYVSTKLRRRCITLIFFMPYKLNAFNNSRSRKCLICLTRLKGLLRFIFRKNKTEKEFRWYIKGFKYALTVHRFLSAVSFVCVYVFSKENQLPVRE